MTWFTGLSVSQACSLSVKCSQGTIQFDPERAGSVLVQLWTLLQSMRLPLTVSKCAHQGAHALNQFVSELCYIVVSI